MVKIQTVRWDRGVGGGSSSLFPLKLSLMLLLLFLLSWVGAEILTPERQESDSSPGITNNPLSYAAQVIFTHWETSSSAQGGS